MINLEGVITGMTVTPASGDEREALWDLVAGIRGLLIGDKGDLGAFLNAELTTLGIDLQTPLRANMTDPRDPQAVRRLTRTRRRVETVIGQLAQPFPLEKVWARDLVALDQPDRSESVRASFRSFRQPLARAARPPVRGVGDGLKSRTSRNDWKIHFFNRVSSDVREFGRNRTDAPTAHAMPDVV